jgi:diguanylate cyclase (GGDEF)-like protein
MFKYRDIALISRKESIVSIIINSVGAIIAFVYLNVIDPAPTSEKSISSLGTIDTFIFIALLVLFVFIGISWGNKIKNSFIKWQNLIESGEKTIADVPYKIKRDVLNFPLYAAGIASLMWTPSSLVAAYVTGSSRVLVGLLGWGGGIAIVLLFFVNDLLWRPVIPVFFPDGNLSEVKAIQIPILGKLLIVFLFTGILLPSLLVGLTWQRANMMLSVPNPETVLDNLRLLQIFILAVSVISSVGLAFFTTRGITKPLDELCTAMKQVQEDDLDAKAVVTTNDEIGFLGERFNQMTAELHQKEILFNANVQLRDQLVKIKSLETALREQAIRDSLTGLFNRRYMTEALEAELYRAVRKKSKLSVVMLDVDNLKEINDQYGHVEGGDQCLKALATTLQIICRREDIICRYAGDEFVVIMYDTSAQIAYERALEWKDAVSSITCAVGEEETGVAFSAGIAEYSSVEISAKDLLQCADRALYQAKDAGRNQIMIYGSAGAG